MRSLRSFVVPLLKALGLMSSTTTIDVSRIRSEFGLNGPTHVGDFRDRLQTICHIYQTFKRAEDYYVSELRIMKDNKNETCHEYVVAAIKRTDGTPGIVYLTLERTPGKAQHQGAPRDETSSVPSPDNDLESQFFKEKAKCGAQSRPNDKDREDPLQRQLGATRKSTSTTSSGSFLDSIQKKNILANDFVRVLEPGQKSQDNSHQVVAVLHLQRPPRTPSTHPTDRDTLERSGQHLPTISGDNTISYFDRNDTSPAGVATAEPIPRKWIYLYELAIMAHQLHRCTSLYRVFTDNCYWFAGMMLQIARVWTNTSLELHQARDTASMAANEDTMSWQARQLGTWMGVIRIMKTPSIKMVEVLVEEVEVARVQFEAEVNHLLKLSSGDNDKALRKKDEVIQEERRRADEEHIERQRVEEERQRERQRADEERIERQRAEEVIQRKDREIQEERRRADEERIERQRAEEAVQRKDREIQEEQRRYKLLLECMQAGKMPPPDSELLRQTEP